MTEVYFVNQPDKLRLAFDRLNISDFQGKRTLVKLHMGEPGNKMYIYPALVKTVVSQLKSTGADPFLFDSTVLYRSPRNNKDGYLQVADRNGFTPEDMGCDIVISDQSVPVAADGHTLSMDKYLHESSHMVASVTDTILPGVVSAPHHWPGDANINLLVDDRNLDPISGFPPFKSLLCQVARQDT